MHEFNTLRFWRLKKARTPRPEFTKAFAMFAVRRSRGVPAYTQASLAEIFGLSKKQLTEYAVFKEGIAVWLDKNFDAIDHLSPFSDESLILRFRRSDGEWLDVSVSIELDMGESFESTMEAFMAEKVRADMEKFIKKPAKKTGLGGRKRSSGIL